MKKLALLIAAFFVANGLQARWHALMVYEPQGVAIVSNAAVSAAQVKDAFYKAGAKIGHWSFAEKGADHLIATFNDRDKYQLVIDIELHAKEYSIHYVSSVNLRYHEEDRTIDKKYEAQVRNLERKMTAFINSGAELQVKNPKAGH